MISYVSEQTLCRMYELSPGTICRHVGCMRKIPMYQPYIIGSGKGTRVDPGAYRHWRKHRKQLNDIEGRRYVKPYEGEAF